MQKKHFHMSVRTMQSIGLGTLCALGAFTMGIETSGDVHPFSHSEAALQEVLSPGTDLRGDINGNGKIDAEDAYILYEVTQGLEPSTPDWVRRGDVNHDGILDGKDLGYVLHLLSNQ